MLLLPELKTILFISFFSLVWSSSVKMENDRKQKIADFIDQAIEVSTKYQKNSLLILPHAWVPYRSANHN